MINHGSIFSAAKHWTWLYSQAVYNQWTVGNHVLRSSNSFEILLRSCTNANRCEQWLADSLAFTFSCVTGHPQCQEWPELVLNWSWREKAVWTKQTLKLAEICETNKNGFPDSEMVPNQAMADELVQTYDQKFRFHGLCSLQTYESSRSISKIRRRSSTYITYLF